MGAQGCHLLITGGTGYIGTALVRLALAQGCTVTVLSRTPPPWPAHERLHYVPYTLGEPLSPDLFKTAQGLIHLAADTSSGGNRLPEQVEMNAGRNLFAAASAQGCRFVFVSSQSARQDAPAPYGRIKWRIEQAVLQGSGYVVRPGLVYGGRRAAGLFGVLCGLVQRLPILPDLRPRPYVQPIHIHDLCLALLQLTCDREAQPGVYALGAPQGVSFTDFLHAIARYRVRKMRLYLPVPMRLLTGFTRLHKMCPWLPDFSSERLLGFAALRPMATQASLQQLALELRSLPAGMGHSSAHSRHELAWEGHALLSYVTGRKPFPGLVKRYVRGVELLYGATPLPVPMAFLCLPQLFCLLDTNQRLLDLYGWRQVSDRLALAVALAEASPAGAVQFLQLHRRGRVAAWFDLLSIIMQEAAVKGLQWGCILFVLIVSRWRVRS